MGNSNTSPNKTPKSVQITWVIFSLWYVICRVGFEVNSYREYGIKLGHEPLPILSKIKGITGLTPKSLFDTTHLPIIYPLTNTRSPFYYPWFMPAFKLYPEDKQELLQVFKEKNIQYVIWSDTKLWHNPEDKKHFKHFIFRGKWPDTNYNFEDMAPRVAKYIRKYYKWIGSVGAFQVLKHNGGKPIQFKHFYEASSEELKLVDKNKPNQNLKPDQIILKDQSVSFHNSKNYYYYTTGTIHLKGGQYELEVNLAYELESNSKGVEVMIGNWDSGNVVFGTKLANKEDQGDIKSYKFYFPIKSKNNFEIRISSLGNTFIYLDKISLKVLN